MIRRHFRRSTGWLVCVIAMLTLGRPPALLNAQVGDRAEVDRSAPPPHWALPDGRLRSAEETVRHFELPSEFRVEVIAAEPLVQDPIAFQFDERGRLWVLEWPAYNWALRDVLGLEAQPAPKSRVVTLEDTDGDGRMDRRTVFMDDIVWPRGLQVSRDGVLVLALPELIFARDTNGDGRADRREIVLKNLEIPANPHNAVNTVLRGMDNWLYLSKLPRRLRPTSDGWRESPHPMTRGQWGGSFDNVGRVVYASNGDHLRGDLVPAHYFGRHTDNPLTDGIDVRYPENQFTFPMGPTPGVNRRAQLREENGTLHTFTSNTGPCVYRGDQFPPEYVGNVFLGEVGGRFIRRSVLTEKNGEISARNAYEGREFLYSRDERFRPVYTGNGPDGALYVADMARGIIEGDIFVTSFLRNQAMSRKLHEPFNGRGRIYRIVHLGRPLGAPPQVAVGNLRGWVPQLAHANGFWRDTAQRLLVEGRDRAVVPLVREVALKHEWPVARLHALWTLDGLDAADETIVTAALRDTDAAVRIAALRLSENFIEQEAWVKRIAAVAEDPKLDVQRQVLLTLGETRHEQAEATMATLLLRHQDRPTFSAAAVSGLKGREAAMVRRLGLAQPEANSPGLSKVVQALAQALADSGNASHLEQLLGELAGETLPSWLRVSVLDGIRAATKRDAIPVPASLVRLEKVGDDALRTRAAALAKNWASAKTSTPTVAIPRSAVFDRGKELFGVCAACHGPEGKGQPNIAPPLEGSAVVTGPVEELLRSIINGRNLNRANPAYPDMPPLAGLPDADIAAVASYVRARWGGTAQAIAPAEVARVR